MTACSSHPPESSCLFCAMGGDPAVHGKRAALDAASPWVVRASIALDELRVSREPFTSEDITARAGLPRGAVGTNRNNAVGAFLSKAAKAGRIRRVGETPSTRRSSHGAMLAVWQGVWPK